MHYNKMTLLETIYVRSLTKIHNVSTKNSIRSFIRLLRTCLRTSQVKEDNHCLVPLFSGPSYLRLVTRGSWGPESPIWIRTYVPAHDLDNKHLFSCSTDVLDVSWCNSTIRFQTRCPQNLNGRQAFVQANRARERQKKRREKK